MSGESGLEKAARLVQNAGRTVKVSPGGSSKNYGVQLLRVSGDVDRGCQHSVVVQPRRAWIDLVGTPYEHSSLEPIGDPSPLVGTVRFGQDGSMSEAEFDVGRGVILSVPGATIDLFVRNEGPAPHVVAMESLHAGFTYEVASQIVENPRGAFFRARRTVNAGLASDSLILPIPAFACSIAGLVVDVGTLDYIGARIEFLGVSGASLGTYPLGSSGGGDWCPIVPVAIPADAVAFRMLNAAYPAVSYRVVFDLAF